VPGRVALALAGALLGAGLSVPAAAEARGEFSISSESLRPAFTRANLHYTVSCSQPVRVRVTAGAGAKARVGAGPAFRGKRIRRVRLSPGQALGVRKGTRRYVLRCLPAGFPSFRYAQHRRGRVGLYAVTPQRLGERAGNYVVIFNRFGAPVWWLYSKQRAIDAKVLADGTIAYATYYGGGYGADERLSYRFVRPSGEQVAELRAVGVDTDFHELVPTRDGNFLLLAYKPRARAVDTTSFNGDRSARVIDSVVQKLTPKGRLLWRWNSRDHVRLAETGRWWARLSEPYDLTHINSVEELRGGDLMISLRHTDAVYRLDRSTGAVVWKLGGTVTPQSLRVPGRSSATLFGGQHDARQLRDGTITVFDNGTDLDRPPRTVRFRIAGRLAQPLAAVREPFVARSPCCGSARRLPGSWLVSWGGSGIVGGYLPDGRRIFTLDLRGAFSYRAAPVRGLTERRLSKGMDRRASPRG
jgi:hypothetical protein